MRWPSREAQTAASLSGEANVIVIHDVGETRDDLPFIVMEYVPGVTVADSCALAASTPSRCCAGSSKRRRHSIARTRAGSSIAT